MAPSILFLLLLLPLVFFNPTSGDNLKQHEEGFISVVISDKGLDFAKDLLIEQAIASIVKSQLPQIEKSVQVPLVGKARVVLSEITMKDIQINSSSVKTGETGISVVVSGATANLDMNWRYTVSSWLVPIGISDSGTATVKVQDLQVGVTVNLLRNQEGTLKLILLDYGCHVGDISIKLNGGVAWLYQVLVDAFEGNIASAVEEAVSQKVREGIATLDNLLESIPKTISIDNIAALNVTLVDDPLLSDSSVEVEINGLIIGRNEVLVPRSYHKGSEISASCGGSPTMIKISLHEDVFKSASSVYFAADSMQWILDELPDQALLNTAEWRFIIPQLYKQYPNDNMNLNVSASSPPVIQVTDQDIKATISLDIIIDVLEAGEVIPVACISVDVSASAAAEIIGNNLTGKLKLIKFSTHLEWSKIGKLHMQLIQSLASTTLKTVIIPYMNSQLKRGIPLPILNGFAVKNAHILYSHPWIAVCSDVSFLGNYVS